MGSKNIFTPQKNLFAKSLLLSHSWSLVALAIQGAPPAINVHPSPLPSRSSTQPSTWGSGMSNVGSLPSSSSTQGAWEQLLDPDMLEHATQVLVDNGIDITPLEDTLQN